MAQLDSNELTGIRGECAKTFSPISYTKPQLNAAAQAAETFLAANGAAISSAIDAATTPFVFSNAQKKKIVAEVLNRKFLRDK
jgi:hypothetical protein